MIDNCNGKPESKGNGLIVLRDQPVALSLQVMVESLAAFLASCRVRVARGKRPVERV